MFTNLFSQSTNDTKRNLLFISVISFLISFEIIDIFKVSIIKDVLGDSSNFFYLNVSLLFYLNVASYIRLERDSAISNMNNYSPSKKDHLSKIAFLLNGTISSFITAEINRGVDLDAEVSDITEFEKKLKTFHSKNSQLTMENIKDFAKVIGETRNTAKTRHLFNKMHSILEVGVDALDKSSSSEAILTNRYWVETINYYLNELTIINELHSSMKKKLKVSNFLDSRFPNLLGVFIWGMIVVKHFY